MERARGAELEDLLVHSDWLTRLAHRLTGAGDADDVVQETWIAARRSPPDPERPPRPWLAGVLRNLVRARWQSDRRRRRREQDQALLAPDHAAAVDTMYERVEMQRLVAQRVMALDEPLRTVVLLRYFEGHDSTEIAEILRLPAGTVRWRLKTAIDRLRTDMDARFGGDRRAWAVVLAPGALAPTWPFFGAAIAACLALVLGAGVGVGLGAWSGKNMRPGAAGVTAVKNASPPPPAAAAADTRSDRALTRPRAAAAAGTPSDRDLLRRVAALADSPFDRDVPRLRAPAPVDTIAGVVFAAGEPEDDAVVVATAIDTAAPGAWPDTPAPRSKSTEGGRFLLSSLRPGRYRLTATGHSDGTARSADIDLPAGHAIENVVLDLRAAPAGLAGRVLDAVGLGIPRARVRARLADPPLVFETESGCLGRYHLDLEAGLYGFEIEADGYAPTQFTLLVQAPLQRHLHLFSTDPATSPRRAVP